MIDGIKQLQLDSKHARIIAAMGDQHNISTEEAMRIFYNSQTAQLIDDGVADLHCRSSRYLADEVWAEYEDSK